MKGIGGGDAVQFAGAEDGDRSVWAVPDDLSRRSGGMKGSVE